MMCCTPRKERVHDERYEVRPGKSKTATDKVMILPFLTLVPRYVLQGSCLVRVQWVRFSHKLHTASQNHSLKTQAPHRLNLSQCICFEIHKTRAWIVVSPEVIASSVNDDELSYGCLTKLMTLRVASSKIVRAEGEHHSHKQCRKGSARIRKSRLKLKVGESMSLHDVAIGVLMCEGSGLATLLAEHATSSLDDFVKRMNEEASRLGMSHTRFVNPHGRQ